MADHGAGHVPRFVLYADRTERATGLAPRVEARVRISPHRRRVLIARPDGYLGFAGAADAWEEAERYLQRCTPLGDSAQSSC